MCFVGPPVIRCTSKIAPGGGQNMLLGPPVIGSTLEWVKMCYLAPRHKLHPEGWQNVLSGPPP